MRYLLGFLLLVFLAIVGLFAVQNMKPVTIWLLNTHVEAPVALVTVAAYLLGMASGGSVFGFLRSSIRRVSAEPRSK